MANLRVVNGNDDDTPAPPPLPDAELIAAASTLSGARDLMAEMAGVAVSYARDQDQDARIRIGAATAASQILARLPSVIEAQLDLEKREKHVAARKLGLQLQDPFTPVDKVRAKNLLVTLAKQQNINVKD